VLSLPPSVRVFVATQTVDGRKQADSLMAVVRDVFGHDPLSGHLFVFFSKRLDVEAAWAAEIERRVRRLDQQGSRGRPWQEIFDSYRRQR
jgi:IS66 Orf2 like protein